MSEPEIKLEVDEHGRIECRVTNEGVLLSKDEKEFIIDHITRMQAENATLREACAELLKMAESHDPEWLHWPEMHEELRKLGVEA